MSNHYRLNVRFDLNDEAERRAAEYLAELNNKKGKSRNRFIVEAVISFIERKTATEILHLMMSGRYFGRSYRGFRLSLRLRQTTGRQTRN